MPDYTPTKVLLHDPDGVAQPKSLYPVTVLPAIVAGISGDALTTSITNDNNQIKTQYLELVSGGTVQSNYLPIGMSDGKIANDSLDIFNVETITSGGSTTTTYTIKSELLPSYVDDVVEIPVLLAPDYPADADLFIRETPSDNGTTYTFYKRVADNSWEVGGGQTGKIYVADDTSAAGAGSMFRAVSGSESGAAVKISENPYTFAQTKVNGVSLNISNGVITAKADSATATNLGTVQIDTTPSRNIKLTISGGTLGVSAGFAAGVELPGLVYAAGTTDDDLTLTSSFGNTYVVPTTKYMKDYVTSAVVGVNYATSSVPGIVMIGSNIQVASSGLISVRDATSAAAGVVCIVDTIAQTAAGNTGNIGKAVTLGGITTYVGGVLAGYQKYLAEGNAIYISRGTGSDTISVKYAAPLILSGGSLTVDKATTGQLGAVVYTGDSSYITNGTIEDANGNPIVTNPKAVKDYVAAAIQAAHVNVKAPLYYDTNDGLLTASNATTASRGVVMLTSTLSYDGTGQTYSSYVVPTANAVQSTLSAGLATKLNSVTFSSGVVNSNGTVKAVVDASTYPWMHLDANGIGVTKASTQQAGVVKLVETSAAMVADSTSGSVPTASAVIDYVTSEISSMGINGSAQYVSASGVTDVPLGGVRVVSSMGIGLNSGNIYMMPATANTLGGIQLATEGTGLEMLTGGSVLAIKRELPLFVSSNTLIVSKAADATTSGVVTVLSNTAAIVANSAVAAAVPNAAGVLDYVASNNSAIAGAGLVYSGGALNISAIDPLYTSGSELNIRTANAATEDVLPTSALGAVYVRGVVRSATVIESSGGRIANTVPTEQAVRSALDSAVTSITSMVDNRMYITYTPLNN